VRVRRVRVQRERPAGARDVDDACRRLGRAAPWRLVGASRAEQVAQNVASPSVDFTPEQTDRLEQVTAPPSLNPDFIFIVPTARIFGGQDVRRW